MITVDLFKDGKCVGVVRQISLPKEGDIIKTKSGKFRVISANKSFNLQTIGNFAVAIVQEVTPR